MDYVERLLAEWSTHACGVTIDFIGRESSDPKLQWALAFPLERHEESLCVNFLDVLRKDLNELGMQHVDDMPKDGDVRLPNRFALEQVCPYRPDSCLGEHLLASGIGLIST